MINMNPLQIISWIVALGLSALFSYLFLIPYLTKKLVWWVLKLKLRNALKYEESHENKERIKDLLGKVDKAKRNTKL